MDDLTRAAGLLAAADAVLFDFNGTLSLDEDVFAGLYLRAAAQLGIPLTQADYDERFLGRTDPEVCAALAGGDAATEAWLWEFVSTGYRDEVTRRPRIPAAHVALLRHLTDAGARLAIVSNCAAELVAPAMDAAGITGLVDAVVTADDLARPKPDPEAFLTARARLDLAPDAAVVAVEDSPTGLAAALAAGLPTIVVGEHAAAAPPGAIGVRDLTALAEVLVNG